MKTLILSNYPVKKSDIGTRRVCARDKPFLLQSHTYKSGLLLPPAS